jgi:two-component system CheB/CheR fusion protein
MKNETLNDTSELLLKRIKQLAKIGTWEYNLEKDELTASEEAFEIFGITDKPSSVNLDFFFKNIHPDDFEKVRTEYSNSIINRSLSYEIEHRVINKTDNSIKYVLEKCDNIINKDGKVEKSLGIIQDISDRKNIADELSLSTGKFESIFKTAPLGIGVVVNRTFSEVNKYFLSMLGYTQKELLGQNARIIYPSDEEYENVGKVKYRQINKSGIGFVQTKFKTKKGKIIDISMYSRPIDLADYSKGVIFTAEDITIFKKLQNDLKSS